MHQIRLRPFDCCLPLCLKSDWALDQVLWVYDPFGYTQRDGEFGSDVIDWTMAGDLVAKAREDHHIHRIDVPGEVL